MNTSIREIRTAAVAAVICLLSMASLACASPIAPRPSTYILVGPDPSLSMAPDDMKDAGAVIKKRLDTAGLYSDIEVSDTHIKVYYASADDLETVTKLATNQGILIFFGSEKALIEGSAVPEDAVAVLTDLDIESVETSEDQQGLPAIDVKFTQAGAEILSDYSSAHVDDYLIIGVDGIVLSSPTLTAPITGGIAQIAGVVGGEEGAKLLANQLSSGRLPFPLQLLETH